jgi:hypothetical protein
MGTAWQQMFVGKSAQVLTQLTNANIGDPDTLLNELCSLPGIPDTARQALTKPSTQNTLGGLAPIEYLACGLLKHSKSHPSPQILSDWKMGAAGTNMRINRIRLLAVQFFA